MTGLFPPWPLLSAFLIAGVVLAITPGPGVFYIVTRSIVQGRRYGLASAAGVAFGNLGNALAAAVGLAAVFSLSSLAFSVVKYAGAAYLIYLGIRMFRSSNAILPLVTPIPASPGYVFRDGFIVALLNPKTTIFFGAFLPQFLNAGAPVAVQSIALGFLFVTIAAVTDSLYAFAASVFAPALRGGRPLRIGQRTGGSVLIVLGLFTAFAGVRSGK